MDKFATFLEWFAAIVAVIGVLVLLFVLKLYYDRKERRAGEIQRAANFHFYSLK